MRSRSPRAPLSHPAHLRLTPRTSVSPCAPPSHPAHLRLTLRTFVSPCAPSSHPAHLPSHPPLTLRTSLRTAYARAAVGELEKLANKMLLNYHWVVPNASIE
ncbi:hypothetical protein PMIN01_11832 [Paraphaeosphaeria minitans]|uniref:Uncharacterized protein n=1 Tax=Paraphaeosphaeria minitans TaxID=565426 RepID=A0A9P6G6S2_9PLEO|nr:hypothetical protein PMIN01_11832 [Paraphaeosphaeria minitans]